MEQFNPNTYKKQSTAQEFTGSCLGKIIICAAIIIILLIIAAITRPTDSYMRWQMEDNIMECVDDVTLNAVAGLDALHDVAVLESVE